MSWEKEKPKKGKKVVIKKPVVKEKPPEPVQEEIVVPMIPQGPLCICGKPVAVGQSEVCVDHIRRG